MRTAHPVTKKDSKQIISDDKNWDNRGIGAGGVWGRGLGNNLEGAGRT